MSVQLVWYKRDLRVHDHAPLRDAAARGPVLPLYVAEPDYWALPDTSGRQWAAIADGLRELRDDLAALGQPLVIRTGDVLEVLAALHARHGLAALWSYEETGNAWTYARDRRVAAWARAQGIPWHEIPSGGVVRRLRSRDRWASNWEARLAPVPLPPPVALPPIAGLDPGQLPDDAALGIAPDPCEGRQRGGRRRGERALQTFLAGRGAGYMRGMSSPLSAETRCSRFSVALATGTLSLREVVHAVRAAREAGGPVPARDLASLEKRLHWHCHFIQKLESEPGIEFRNMHRGFDGLREG